MPNTINKIRIHNELISVTKAGAFYAVDFDNCSGAMQDVDEAVATPVPPSSVYANELSAQIGDATNYRMSYQRQRSEWTWLVKAKWSCQVTSYRFEEALMLNPPCLVMDPDQRQVQLMLERVQYQHSTTGQPHSGSLIEFYFNARPLRR